MATLKIATPLRTFTGGLAEVRLQGKTVAGALNDLMDQYPALRGQIFNQEGNLRAFVHLFVNDEDIQHLQGMDTPLGETDRMMLIPSIAGG
jgi:molybdopterin converting factor small subunit